MLAETSAFDAAGAATAVANTRAGTKVLLVMAHFLLAQSHYDSTAPYCSIHATEEIACFSKTCRGAAVNIRCGLHHDGAPAAP
jgi:hypothetical protein